MPEDLPSVFNTFVEEARTTLGVAGASAELSVTGKLDNFLTAALPTVTARPLHVSQQTGTEFGIPDFRATTPASSSAGSSSRPSPVRT
jgi:hypothetical protein